MIRAVAGLRGASAPRAAARALFSSASSARGGAFGLPRVAQLHPALVGGSLGAALGAALLVRPEGSDLAVAPDESPRTPSRVLSLSPSVVEEMGSYVEGLPEYTLADVAAHKSAEAGVWVTLGDAVYDVRAVADSRLGSGWGGKWRSRRRRSRGAAHTNPFITPRPRRDPDHGVRGQPPGRQQDPAGRRRQR